jgi:hypothetical protein
MRAVPADKKEELKKEYVRAGGGKEWRSLVLTASKSHIEFFFLQKGELVERVDRG